VIGEGRNVPPKAVRDRVIAGAYGSSRVELFETQKRVDWSGKFLTERVTRLFMCHGAIAWFHYI
jgi:hypothetical protein